jgi:hypothetical protein
LKYCFGGERKILINDSWSQLGKIKEDLHRTKDEGEANLEYA